MPTLNRPTDGARSGRYGAELFEHTVAEEDERLTLIEEEQDPYTTALIESFGIASDWHCLEIGAGKGSMAYWLADRCPNGRVVATDLDVRLNTVGRPNLTALRHDIATDDFPAGLFHLVHARAVLTHVPDPEAVCARIACWLRPGGWLLVTDPASFTVDSSPHPLMRKAAAAAKVVMQDMIGTDPNWARTFPAPLARVGFVDVDAECRLRMMQGGGREARMFELMLAQLAPHLVTTGLITDAELDTLRAQLLDPAFMDFPPAVVRAWGRRP